MAPHPARTLRLVDRQRRLARVRLVQEIGLTDVDLTRVAGEWRTTVEPPDVDRMEYLFELEDHNGNRWTIVDPANPLRAPGAFGEKSVLEFAGYRAPDWLDLPGVASSVVERAVDVLDAEMGVRLWAPDTVTPDEPAPLLVVHDGPEYATLGGFTDFVAAQLAGNRLPPLRVALLDPGDRNAWYSANRGYAQALCEDVLPGLAPATVRIGVGVSLGALAVLHAHRTHPSTFDALFLQSGSFFTPELDPQEADFDGFAAVTGFVAATHAAHGEEDPVPATLTCGTVEENLGNNRLMAATLQRLGYRAQLHERRDAHNYTAWRDALAPHLVHMVCEVAGARAT